MESGRNQWLLLHSFPFVVLFATVVSVLVLSLHSILQADAPGLNVPSKLEIEQLKGDVLEMERDLDELDKELEQLEQRVTNLEGGSVPQVTSHAPLPSSAPPLPPAPRAGLEKPLPRSGAASSELLEAIREGIGLRKTEGPTQRQPHSSSPIFQQLSARRMQLGYEDSDSDESSEWEE